MMAEKDKVKPASNDFIYDMLEDILYLNPVDFSVVKGELHNFSLEELEKIRHNLKLLKTNSLKITRLIKARQSN